MRTKKKKLSTNLNVNFANVNFVHDFGKLIFLFPLLFINILILVIPIDVIKDFRNIFSVF